MASSTPPGIGRLALSATDRRDLQKIAGEHGPIQALQHLVSFGYLEEDGLQMECAKQLHEVRDSSFAYASEMLKWRRSYALWLAAFRKRLRDAREKEKEKVRAQKHKTINNNDDRSKRVEPPIQLRMRLERLAVDRPTRPTLKKQGMFIWGGVGRGKSLLMDLFMSSYGLSPNGLVVQRHHYHDFMTAVHQQLHKKRQAGGSMHAVKAVAAEMSLDCPVVLCLDELQVTNIADAVILRDLFGNLFANGSFLVTTCNRPPEDLYKDGLNHMIYMPPFLRLLRDRIHIYHFDSPIDYRERQYESEGIACRMSQSQNDSLGDLRSDFVVSAMGSHSLEALFRSVNDSATMLPDPSPQELLVSWGRRLKCKHVHGGIAGFTFHELCGAPLSADDYSALIQSNSLHTFVVADIPQFALNQHNEARRFTNLVDCLYEAQCRLICTAESSPEDLMYEMASLSDVVVEPTEPVQKSHLERSTRRHGDVTFEVSELSPCRPDSFATAEADAEAGTGDAEILQAVLAARRKAASGGESTAAGVDPTEQDGVAGVTSAALVSLQESGFAARRCVSRLKEMSTEAYHKAHLVSWAIDL